VRHSTRFLGAVIEIPNRHANSGDLEKVARVEGLEFEECKFWGSRKGGYKLSWVQIYHMAGGMTDSSLLTDWECYRTPKSDAEMAGDCYSAALQVFSKEAFPREFAECNSGPSLLSCPFIYIHTYMSLTL
jgi:hypothetical protein